MSKHNVVDASSIPIERKHMNTEEVAKKALNKPAPRAKANLYPGYAATKDSPRFSGTWIPEPS